jgi:hypothetical protein
MAWSTIASSSVLCAVMMTTAWAEPQPSGTTAPFAFGCRDGLVSVTYVIRQDFTDIPLLACPPPSNNTLKTAVGARIAATFDELGHTTTFAPDGLVAGVVRIPGDSNPLQSITLGPFVQANESYQFETPGSPSKTSDTATAGGYFQFVIDNAALGGLNIFRIRGGETFGSSGVVTNTAVAEWQPIYNSTLLGAPRPLKLLLPLNYVIFPEVMLQYDSLASGPNKYQLFSLRDDALRLGPQGVIKFWFDTSQISDSSLRGFLDRISASLTLHSSWDIFTGRNYNWFQSALIYNLDERGNYALSASYGCGNAELTGNQTSQFKLGLAAKF